MNYIIPYNANKGEPINLDLIVSIKTLESPDGDEFFIRFYTVTPGLWFSWEYRNNNYGYDEEYTRLISAITPEENN